MGKDLHNTKIVNNKFIEQRRKRRKIKKSFLLIVILISTSVTLLLKLPYFNIKTIEVVNNRNIPSQEIINLSNLKLEKNIFYLDLKKSKTNILTNSYIVSAQLKRKLPNEIKIFVEERTAVFYIKKENKYLIVDSQGIILEEKDLINNMKLIKLEGFEKSSYEIGEKLDIKEEQIQLIKEITNLIKNLEEGVPEPTIVNLMDPTDIKIIYTNMMIKIGTRYDLGEKYNKALNILIQNNLLNRQGYIDVSFKGEPVFFVSD